MNEQKFTNCIIPIVIARFPQFVIRKANNADESDTLECVSRQEKVILRLSAQGESLTLGFAANKTQYNWHIHMDQFGAATSEEELRIATDFVDNILNHRMPIVHSSLLGFFLTEDIDSIYEYQQKDELIKVYSWADL